MAKYYRYIVCLVFPNQAIHRRGQKTHHTHSHHKSASDNNRRSDKPPGRINNPNRNAKFTSYFLRGEFGVFCHAYKSIAQAVRKYGRTLRVGCRDPPSSDFSLVATMFYYAGEQYILPFRAIFDEKHLPWLKEAAALQMEAKIDDIRFSQTEMEG